jgi:ABC-type multidrug transport system fused ATPase/permease subunit
MKMPFQQYWRLLIKYLRPRRLSFAGLTALLFSNIGLQLINPQIMRFFLDTAQAGGALDILMRAALLFLGVALVQQVVSVWVTYISENLAWATTNDLRADLVEHCLDLDLGFHNAHTPGEMIERVDGDVTTLSNFFSQFVIQIVGNGLLLIGVLVMLFREDWRVGLVLTGFASLALVILISLRNIAIPHWTAERQANADLFGFLEERLAGTEDIRANGAKAYVLRNFFRLMRTQMEKSLKAALMINILFNTLLFLFALGTAVAFAVGAYLFRAQIVTIGTVYLIFQYTRMLERPIEGIVHQVQDFQKAGAGITRIQDLFAIRSRLTPRSVDLQRAKERETQRVEDEGLQREALAVAFQNVTFGYDDSIMEGDGQAVASPSKEIVLRDVSFTLNPGRVLGLLGRTGSGKTTLTRLLFRLYDPDSGTVSLSNGAAPVDIRAIPLRELRRRVGMVTQSIQLFHASVRDNLTFFDPDIPDARILAVIHELGLGAWFEALPHGLDTVLESGGGGLSAGEAQLLAFTRIFLQDPGLVILDEASSRLDPATEALIERAVDRLVQDRTAIIIAHRLGTVGRADEIMILENGHICEYGERAHLARDPNTHFYHLLQTGMEEVLA